MGVPVLHIDDTRLAGLLQPDGRHLALPVGRWTPHNFPLAACGVGHPIAGAELERKDPPLVRRPRLLERDVGLLPVRLLALGA
jgi:hypothetical protein